MMKNIINRLKSPVVWLAIIAMLYTTVLQPQLSFLPEWTNIVGYVTMIFGIANNPTKHNCF